MERMKSRVPGVPFALAVLALLVVGTAASSAAPKWKILLSSDRGGDSEIYSMNADGSGVRRLTHSKGFDGFASPSPDGRKFVSNGASGGYLINADGSGKRPLNDVGCPCSWSPDGRRIVFTSGRDGNGEIYVMNADGSGRRNLSIKPSSNEFAPAWSPDGRTIAFVTDRDGNQEIYAMNADGGEQRNLTRNPLRDGGRGVFAVLWSPDGRTIAFATNRDRNRDPKGKVYDELYVMDADGGRQRRLTRSPEFEELLSWSPDGRQLAFKRGNSKPRWAFFVMNADGTGVRKVSWSLPRQR